MLDSEKQSSTVLAVGEKDTSVNILTNEIRRARDNDAHQRNYRIRTIVSFETRQYEP
jgi:hypothetical protein